MTKPKTQEQLDRATDQRAPETYGRDLAWYNGQLRNRRRVRDLRTDPEGTRRLHVDHDHSWKKVKIETKQNRILKTGVAFVAKANTSANLDQRKRNPALSEKLRRLFSGSVSGVAML